MWNHRSPKRVPQKHASVRQGGITETLDTAAGGGRGHHTIEVVGNDSSNFNRNATVSSLGISPTITARDYKGPVKIAIPVLTPDRANKRQDGRRFKEDGEEAFTLTSRDRHGVAVEVNLNPECIGGIGEKKSNNGSQFFQQDRIYDSEKVATSLSANLPGGANMYDIKMSVKEETNHGSFVKLNNGDEIYTMLYPKKQCHIAIRKLTPKECFRLQGWDDSYFGKAQFVSSDSQLYKQA